MLSSHYVCMRALPACFTGHLSYRTCNFLQPIFCGFLMCCITSTALLSLSESCAKFVPTVPSLQVVLTVSELYSLPRVLDK